MAWLTVKLGWCGPGLSTEAIHTTPSNRYEPVRVQKTHPTLMALSDS